MDEQDNITSLRDVFDKTLREFEDLPSPRTIDLRDSIPSTKVKEDWKFEKDILQGHIFPERDPSRGYDQTVALGNIRSGDVLSIRSSEISDLRMEDENGITNVRTLAHEVARPGMAGVRIINYPLFKVTDVTDEAIEGTFIGFWCHGKRAKLLKNSQFEDYALFDKEVSCVCQDSRPMYRIQLMFKFLQNWRNSLRETETIFRKLEEIAEEVYPGNVELKPCYEVAENSLCEDMFRYNCFYVLLIRFPDIVIRNRREDSHRIRGLYVALGFGMDGKVTFFRGIRGRMEAKEVMASYGHSHLGTGMTTFSNFCTGTGDFSTNLEILKTEYNEELFEVTLTQLQFYLEWESISGGPHHYMQDAITGGSSSNQGLGMRDVKKIAGLLERVLPESMLDDTISVKIHDDGESSSLDIEGLSEVGDYISEHCEEIADQTSYPLDRLQKAYVYVSSSNDLVSNTSLRAARRAVRDWKNSGRYKDKWEDRGFFFHGERIVQDVFIDEDLYKETYDTGIVDLAPRLKSYLKSYIKINFMQSVMEEVNNLERQNDKYNEYKQQIEAFPRRILTSTPVF